MMGALLFVPSVRAADLSHKLKGLLDEARLLQKQGDFAGAWEKYYQLRRAEPNLPKDVIEDYQTCLRRVQQQRRLRDRPAQELLADLQPSDALNAYADVLKRLREKYFDGKKIDYTTLFQYGVEEMRLALEDDVFLKEQVQADKPAALMALRNRLYSLRMEKPAIDKPADARRHLQSVMLSAQADLGIKPTAVIVEFIAGACNALDEYTGYLSPTRLAEIEADLNSNKFVGIGVDLTINRDSKDDSRHLVISRVYPGGPAYQQELHIDDEILSIDGQTLKMAAPSVLVAKLQGEVGTTVEVEVRSGMMTRKIKIERQPVSIPSVVIEPPQGEIGYIHITSFQTGTPQELQSALEQLRGLKALILDLRGNLGGSFPAAVKVAEQFLAQGAIIVYTQRPTKAETAWRSNNKNPLMIPLVVLVDGETASAAEIVAGALKDNNKRATLVGQPTFGKGSIQCLVPLDSLKAGLQVTVARFSSPERIPYDGHGIAPHESIENSMMMVQRAIDIAREKATEMSPMLMMR